MNQNDDKKIHKMYENITTPEYDATKDVLTHIKTVPRKNIALKRVIIIAAVVCLCAVALGAADLLGWQSFNMFGEKTGSGSPILPAITPVPGNEDNAHTPIKRATPEPEDPEVIEHEMRFMDETADDEVRISIATRGNGGYGGGSNSGIRTEDLSRIENIMSINLSPIEIPTYITEGYTFKKGSIDFYVDEDNPPELIYTEDINERTYWIYKLKEGFEQKVARIKLTYANEKGDEFTCDVRLCQVLADSIEHHVSESSVVKTIEIPGFDEGIWVHDKKREFHLNQLSLFKEIPLIDAVDLYSLSFRDLIDSDEELEQDFMNKDIKYISMVCNIYADSLDVDELIKITESIN